MNILFLCLGEFDDLSSSSVHIDVVRELSKYCDVYLVCKAEKNKKVKAGYTEEYGIHVLRVATGAIKTNNFIAKGISTLTVEKYFKKAIQKQFNEIKFDAIIYTTPPITFVDPIRYIKNRDGAFTYLMLKDIFPQNAIDIGVMKKSGLMLPLYQHFRNKEKKLYKISDKIGCMSQANIDFVLANNPSISRDKMELFPNSIYVRDNSIQKSEQEQIRQKYGIPLEKKVFVYGGNLGKPQGIPFLMECLKVFREKDAFFLIIGNGTEYEQIKKNVEHNHLNNAKLIKGMPKSDYDKLVAACDIGMVFLDHRFSIPNFPSRILSYMQAKLPILLATDPNTDVGRVVVDGGFGWWCESNDTKAFSTEVDKALNSDLYSMGSKGFEYLDMNYNVEKNCKELIERIGS